MGYTTKFYGCFQINPPLNAKDCHFLTELSRTRRVKRVGLPAEYGTEGEFYVLDDDACVVDYNIPPKTQPGLYCQWIPTEDGTELQWDGGENFYDYVEWLKYLVENYLKPRGYTVNGEVEWLGEYSNDRGLIVVKNNNIKVGKVKITYEFED